MVTAREQKLGHRYEQIMFTRPDFVWLRPHLPPWMLTSPLFYIMDEDISVGVSPTYINDRHWLMPRDVAPLMLSTWDRLLNGSMILSVHDRFDRKIINYHVEKTNFKKFEFISCFCFSCVCQAVPELKVEFDCWSWLV